MLGWGNKKWFKMNDLCVNLGVSGCRYGVVLLGEWDVGSGFELGVGWMVLFCSDCCSCVMRVILWMVGVFFLCITHIKL